MADDRDLPTVILDAIRDVATHDVRVALPASVESYNAATQTANVAPGFKRAYRDGRTVDTPVVVDVPVAWPRAGGAVVTLPLAAGDTGLLVVCDRALERWRDADGAAVDAVDNRSHHLTDAVFLPGLHTDADAIPATGASATAVIVGWEDGSAQVRLEPSGVARVTAATVHVEGSTVVNLGGSGADAFLVRGADFMTWYTSMQAWQVTFAASCAAALAAGNPLSPPIVCPPLPALPAAILSTRVRTL